MSILRENELIHKKILFLCPSLACGGVERSVLNLMNALQKNNIKVSLGLLRNTGELLSEFECNGYYYFASGIIFNFFFSFFKFNKNIYNFILAFHQINKLIKVIKPDIVLTFTLETTLPMSLRFKKKNNPDNFIWIISEGSNVPGSIDRLFLNKTINKFIKYIISKRYIKADFVTTVSHGLKNSLITNYHIPPTKINTIYNPLKADILQKANIEMTQNNNLLNSDFILAIGRLVPVKGFANLLDSFSKVLKEKDIKLVIFGDGPDRNELQKLADKLDISGKVYFMGFSDNPWYYIKKAKMLVVTSILEGFCNVITEAMALECPVISTACDYGPLELIQDNENGLLVPINDPKALAERIVFLLDNPDICQRFSTAGKVFSQKFIPELICEEYMKMFNDLLRK